MTVSRLEAVGSFNWENFFCHAVIFARKCSCLVFLPDLAPIKYIFCFFGFFFCSKMLLKLDYENGHIESTFE